MLPLPPGPSPQGHSPISPELITKALNDPSKYPPQLKAWIAKLFSGNRDLQIDWPQLPGPKITASPISGGPPPSPSDGDIWIGTSVDSSGVQWMFRYYAASTSAYKWQFIGGAPVFTHYDYPSSTNIGNSVATAIPNCSITVPRGGDYVFMGSGNMSASAAGSWEWLLMLYKNGVFIPGAYYGYPIITTPANGVVSITGEIRVDGAAASDVFTLRAECTATSPSTNAVTIGRLSAIPIRVS